MFGTQVVVASTAVTYNLYTLVNAIDTSIPQNAHQITIQSDPANGSAKLFLGSSTVSSTLYSEVVTTGTLVTYSAEFNGINLKDIYLASDTASTKVNVSMISQ